MKTYNEVSQKLNNGIPNANYEANNGQNFAKTTLSGKILESITASAIYWKCLSAKKSCTLSVLQCNKFVTSPLESGVLTQDTLWVL